VGKSTFDKFICPNCGSGDTRSYKAISEAGTSSGTGHGSISTFDGYSKSVNLNIETTTTEARLTSRPERQWSWQFQFGLAFTGPFQAIGVFLHKVQIGGMMSSEVVTPLIVTFAAGLLLTLWGLDENRRLNADLYERQARWHRMWRCGRCTASFEVADSSHSTQR
jgi:hypothetical protein